MRRPCPRIVPPQLRQRRRPRRARRSSRAAAARRPRHHPRRGAPHGGHRALERGYRADELAAAPVEGQGNCYLPTKAGEGGSGVEGLLELCYPLGGGGAGAGTQGDDGGCNVAGAGAWGEEGEHEGRGVE